MKNVFHQEVGGWHTNSLQERGDHSTETFMIQWEPPCLHEDKWPERVLSVSESFLTSFSVRGMGDFGHDKERTRKPQGNREGAVPTQPSQLRPPPSTIMWLWKLAWGTSEQTKSLWSHFISSSSAWKEQKWAFCRKPPWSRIQGSPTLVRFSRQWVLLRPLPVPTEWGHGAATTETPPPEHIQGCEKHLKSVLKKGVWLPRENRQVQTRSQSASYHPLPPPPSVLSAAISSPIAKAEASSWRPPGRHAVTWVWSM